MVGGPEQRQLEPTDQLAALGGFRAARGVARKLAVRRHVKWLALAHRLQRTINGNAIAVTATRGAGRPEDVRVAEVHVRTRKRLLAHLGAVHNHRRVVLPPSDVVF